MNSISKSMPSPIRATISSSWWSATWKAGWRPSERDRLNAFLAEDPAKRDTFVALCTQACLLASYVDADDDGSRLSIEARAGPAPLSVVARGRLSGRRVERHGRLFLADRPAVRI